MTLRHHPHSSRIAEALDLCLPRVSPWSGDVFRMAEAPFATRTHIISGKGAALYGQRWNPPGLQAVYASLDPAQALIEWNAQRKKTGLTIRRHLPVTQITLIVVLQRVLDFRSPRLRAAFNQPLSRLLAEAHGSQDADSQEIRAQAVGRLVSARHIEGIIVPSAQAPSFYNLVVFIKNLCDGSSLRIHGRRYLLP